GSRPARRSDPALLARPGHAPFGATRRGTLTLVPGWGGSPGRLSHTAGPRAASLRGFTWYLAPSSSGPGRRPLKAVAPVQIRSGLLRELQVEGLTAGCGGQALDHLSLSSAVSHSPCARHIRPAPARCPGLLLPCRCARHAEPAWSPCGPARAASGRS